MFLGIDFEGIIRVEFFRAKGFQVYHYAAFKENCILKFLFANDKIVLDDENI